MILNTTYFGPISWYRHLACTKEPVYLEACENFIKQTDRTRCRIMTANGIQMLSVPVTMPDKNLSQNSGNIRHIRISDHNNWRHLHWQALCSAYGNSPFFEFYADDIRPFFEHKWEYLFIYNKEITLKMCELLDINPVIKETESFGKESAPNEDETATSEPAKAAFMADNIVADTPQRPYYQVFRSRYGFVPDLSILDLLFNMGPESILYLLK